MRVFRACVLADFDCPCQFYPPPHLNNEHLKNYFVNCLMKKRAKVLKKEATTEVMDLKNKIF